jgi:hypothetical protein
MRPVIFLQENGAEAQELIHHSIVLAGGLV